MQKLGQKATTTPVHVTSVEQICSLVMSKKMKVMWKGLQIFSLFLTSTLIFSSSADFKQCFVYRVSVDLVSVLEDLILRPFPVRNWYEHIADLECYGALNISHSR